MRRDTVVFALAGIVFGFVVGYMSASWGARPAAVGPTVAPAAQGGASTAPAAPAAAALDPNEEQALEALAERDPADVGARVELGKLYMDHERWDEAARWYREALELSPDLDNVRTDLVACLVHSGRPAEGLTEFEAVLARDEARVELGNLYMDHERWDEAARWYREALELSPDLSSVRTDLGACLVHAGRPAEGLAEFEVVLQQDESHRNALYNKGIALTELGRTEEAVAAWEEVLRRHPGDPQLAGLQGQIDALRASSTGT